MCDYSLHSVKTRPAKVGDELTVRNFGTGTHGFSAPEDKNVAVCLLPGTELSFAEEVRREGLWPWSNVVIRHRAAMKLRQQATVLQLPVANVGAKLPQKQPKFSYELPRQKLSIEARECWLLSTTKASTRAI